MTDAKADRHYSGILVTTEAAQIDRCRAELEKLPGVEVHYLYPDSGRIVAVQETDTVEQQQDGLRAIQALASVRMAALVEHRIEADASEEEGGSL